MAFHPIWTRPSGAPALSRRGFLAAAGAAGLTLAAAACSSGDASGSATSVSTWNGESAKLVFWSWAPNIDKVVEIWNAKNNGITVTVSKQDGGDNAVTKLLTAIKAGSGAPDLMQVEYQALPTLVSSNALTDISGALAPDVRGHFSDGVWSSVTLGTDAVYAVPQDSGPMAFYYRKDIFAKNNIAVPKDWSGVLVVHAHGGPSLGEPTLARVTGDLQRWKVMLQAGHAWAGTSYRQGGFEVLAAGEDVDRLRRIAVEALGTPRRTVLHGQSWGASVAARMAERYITPDIRPGQTAPGPQPYDGVLLSSGVLAGATRAYDVRVDLRAVYQAVCNNHPRPDEPVYPLWMGMPPE